MLGVAQTKHGVSKAGGARLANVNNCKEATPMNHQELMKLSSVNTGELGRK